MRRAREPSPDGATYDNEGDAATETLHDVETKESAAKAVRERGVSDSGRLRGGSDALDGAEDDLRNEGVDVADGLEDSRSVVEEVWKRV